MQFHRAFNSHKRIYTDTISIPNQTDCLIRTHNLIHIFLPFFCLIFRNETAPDIQILSESIGQVQLFVIYKTLIKKEPETRFLPHLRLSCPLILFLLLCQNFLHTSSDLFTFAVCKKQFLEIFSCQSTFYQFSVHFH